MADYKGIKGFKTQSYAADPVLAGVAGATWSAGGDLGTSKGDMGHAGTQTAGLVFGGNQGSPSPTDNSITASEEYDGTTWVEGDNLATGRQALGGAGTQTAALAFGGSIPPTKQSVTENYNGTTWTEVNPLTVAKGGGGSIGTNTAALYAGGITTGMVDTNEEWNGTGWTEIADINTARDQVSSGGTTTAGLIAGGEEPPGYSTLTEIWNGVSWTAGNVLNTQRVGSGGSGTSTLFLNYGGNKASSTNATETEAWDGTSWTEVNDLATGRTALDYGSQGTQTSCLATGGTDVTPAFLNSTEEFSAGTNIFNQGQIWYNTATYALKYTGLASGTWASGGGMSSYANGIRGFGTQGAAIGVGFYGPSTPLSYTYDGTAWSSINGLNDAPGRYYPGGTGTTTAGICFGGEPGKNNSELWNGVGWTVGATLTTGRNFQASGGTQTAAFGAAGYAPGYTGATELWNGTAWTATGTVPVGVQGAGGNGSTTAAIIYSGITASPSTKTAITYTFDGATWSNANADVNSPVSMFGSSGPQTGNTAALKFGGEVHPGKSNSTEEYDGISWSAQGNIASARRSVGNAGSTTSALFFGGEPPSGNGLTEEYLRTTLTAKTVTVS